MEDNCKCIEQEVADNRQRAFTTWGIALGLTTHPETSARNEILRRSSDLHRFCLFSIHSRHSTQFSPYDFLSQGFQIEMLCFVFLCLLRPFSHRQPSLVHRRQASGLWSGYRFIACSFISAVEVVSDHDRILNSPVASV